MTKKLLNASIDYYLTKGGRSNINVYDKVALAYLKRTFDDLGLSFSGELRPTIVKIYSDEMGVIFKAGSSHENYYNEKLIPLYNTILLSFSKATELMTQHKQQKQNRCEAHIDDIMAGGGTMADWDPESYKIARKLRS